MNNKIVIGIVLVVLVLGGLYYFARGNYQPSQGQPASQQPVGQATQSAAIDDVVVIKNFSFSPATLTIKQGAKVTWINQDSAAHTVKSDAFNSPSLSQGGKFEFTFNNKGSFDYVCDVHPSMKGLIVVE